MGVDQYEIRCIMVLFKRNPTKINHSNHLPYSPLKTDGSETIAAASHNCTAHVVEVDLEKLNFYKLLLPSHRPFVITDSFVSEYRPPSLMTQK